MWLQLALRLLRGLGPGLVAGELLESTSLPVLGGGDGGGVLSLFGGREDGKPMRRRRRRALTQSDRNDIAFISATLGAPAGKQFAMIIASRVS